MYHYQGPAGQFQGLTAEQVASYVRSMPGAHYVWAQGMAAWTLAEQVPALAAYAAPAHPAGGPPALGAVAPTPGGADDPMAAYREELDAMNRLSEREGNGNAFDWYNPGKPATQGQSIMSRFRLIPMPVVDAQGSPIIDPRTGLPQRAQKFWTRATRHQVKLPDGTSQSFVCIDDHDNLSAPKTCPLCALKRVLDDTHDKSFIEVARDIRPQQRCYANVIDLDKYQSHWEQVTQPDGSQGYRVRPKVWGYSKTLHTKLMQIAVAKGTFLEDPVHGRDLTLICNRIGKAQRDIRYDITDSDVKPLPTEFYPILQGASNLDVLGKQSTVEELAKVAAEIDPRPRHMRGGGGYTPGAPGGVAPAHQGPPPGYPGAQAPAGYGGPPAAASAPAGYGGPPAGYAAPSSAAPPANFPPPAPAAPVAPAVFYRYHGPTGTADGLSPDDVAGRVIGGPGPHYVWTDGMAEWAEPEKLPNLAQVIAARRAPPPAAVAPPVAPPAPTAPAGPPPAPPSAPPAQPAYAQPAGGPPPGPPATPPGGPPQPPGAPGAW